jgi:DNA-binding NarL/FixJ family response regulator
MQPMVRGASLSILLADDHPLVRRGLRTLLEMQRGWVVCAEAGSGSEAIRKAMKLKPDVALLDISMPYLDGLEAAAEIRRASPKTKVLILSTHFSEDYVRAAVKAGALGYVLKSEGESNLISAITALMNGRRYYTNAPIEASRSLPKPSSLSHEAGRNSLSPREQQVLRLLAEGKSNKQLASELGISTRTAENHRARVMVKLDLHSLSELVKYAIRHRIVEV